MYLILRQLVCANFPGVGYKTFAGDRISLDIQQAFTQLVLHDWDEYRAIEPELRAVYLYQLTPEQSLFGWLYNDWTEKITKSKSIPYFIGYYLQQPIPEVKLENIFTCLHRGPVSLINPHHLATATLETLMVRDFPYYQGTKPGLEIPPQIRQRCQVALKQGKLLDLFYTGKEVETGDRRTKTIPSIFLFFKTWSPDLQKNRSTNSFSTNKVCYKTLAEVPNVPQGIFAYGGSRLCAPLYTQQFTNAIALAHPQFHLLYKKIYRDLSGSDQKIDLLLQGELNFLLSSQPLSQDEQEQAREHGFTLEQIPVALDGIVFFTHPEVAISKLSVTQLQGIFTAQIINWKQLGGENLPIIPFSYSRGNSSTIKSLLASVKELSLGQNVLIVPNSSHAIRLVAATPGSISYAAASEIRNRRFVHPLSLAGVDPSNYGVPFTYSDRLNAKVIQNGSYPFIQKLFVIMRRDGQIGERAGIAYANLLLSHEGQQLIERAGLVPLRDRISQLLNLPVSDRSRVSRE
jgi:phosphate transport system substrate-binding protein